MDFLLDMGPKLTVKESTPQTITRASQEADPKPSVPSTIPVAGNGNYTEKVHKHNLLPFLFLLQKQLSLETVHLKLINC